MVFTFLKGVSQKRDFWVLAHVLLFLAFALIAWRYYPAQNQVKYQLDLSLNILHGQVPYVDFTSEYPPLALLSYLLPALLFRSPISYYVAFTIELLLCDLLAIALIVRISQRLGMSVTRSLLIYALVVIAVGPIIVASYDIIPAVLVLASFYFFFIGKSKVAWAFVGLGLMTKLYPIIVAPFFALYQLRQRQYQQMAKGVITLVIVGLALSLPWLLLNANDFLYFFTFHLERGLHSESTLGSILLFGKVLGLVQVQGIYNFGSFNLYAPVADRLAGFSLIIMAGLLGAVYLLYARAILRAPDSPVETAGLKQGAAATLLKYVLAAVFIFLLSGKVFSMQYLVWLCPLLPLVTGRWQIPLLACFLIAGAFSQFIYPYFYAQFEQSAPSLVAMMFARNVLLIAGAVFVLLPGERQPNRGSESGLRNSTY